jgi:structure-specific recognition protein 1
MSVQIFENIHLNQSRQAGQARINNAGLGWKASEKATGGSAKASEPFLLPSDEVMSASWSRAAKGYEIKVYTKAKGIVQLDGFQTEDFNLIKQAFSNFFNVNVETREHATRGWNWGEADFERDELVFSVSGKPAFEIPYRDVSNSNLVGKTEVAVEFNLLANEDRQKGGDELVEMRFYVPGVISTGASEVKEEEGEEKAENGVDDQSAAQVFYDSLKEKADIGVVAGEAIVSFTDTLLLTPRGRYDIDMYPTSFRLRGKTYDYKIPYKNIQRLFLLPKPDDTHNVLIVQLDPPLRQGQTRYPFLVMQFLKEEELEVELNVDEAEFQEKYADKLKQKYDEAAHQVVGQLFKGLSGRKVIFPGSFSTSHGQAGIACSLKASEGYIYPLEKCFMFVPKPNVYIPNSEIAFITFSRVGGSVSSSRTFDMTITLRNNGGDHQFANIDKEEQQTLEKYITGKGIKLKNDIAQEQQLLAAALGDESESDGEDYADRGSADDDDESPDEDFVDEDEDDDVAEEFDSDAGSSGGEDEDDYASDDGEGTRASKKRKT